MKPKNVLKKSDDEINYRKNYIQKLSFTRNKKKT